MLPNWHRKAAAWEGGSETGTQAGRPQEAGTLKPRPGEEKEPVTEDGRQNTQAQGRARARARREEARPPRGWPDAPMGLCGGTAGSRHREKAGSRWPATSLPHAQKRGSSSRLGGWLPKDFSSLALLAC